MPCKDWIPSILQVQMASCTLRFWSQMSTMESRSGEHKADWKTWSHDKLSWLEWNSKTPEGAKRYKGTLPNLQKQTKGNKKTTTKKIKKQRHENKNTGVFHFASRTPTYFCQGIGRWSIQARCVFVVGVLVTGLPKKQLTNVYPVPLPPILMVQWKIGLFFAVVSFYLG